MIAMIDKIFLGREEGREGGRKSVMFTNKRNKTHEQKTGRP